jgi:hypothetical protein
MRKFLISMVAAGSALAFAAPATAQYAQVWAPPVYNYQPYNFNYGFNGYNFARSMHDRVQRIRGDIRVMQSRRVLSYNEARRLDREAVGVERKIARASRYGINAYEARNVENSIRRLERHVAREANDWNRRYGNRYGYRRY